MASLNKVMLIGNLTRDPQLSYLPSQTAVVEIGLAVNNRWTGQDGQKHEETCFVDCQAFSRQAENINKYLTKGSPVFIEGRLKFDSWTAQDGTKRSKHRVTIMNCQFLSGGGQGQGGGGGDKSNNMSGGSGVQGDSQHGEESFGGHEDIPF